jgi:hypothetical protein
MDLSLWEQFYLQDIESLQTLYELDYWPPQDQEVNQRSLTLPAVGDCSSAAVALGRSLSTAPAMSTF